MTDAHDLSALDAARAIREGRLTSEALVEACLARIRERDEAVGAWIHLDPEAALAEARARDRETPRSALHGVPVGVKDIVDTHDMPTGYGSPIHAGFRPGADAAPVALLRAAGMVALGKTVTTEFAMRHPGKTRNPANPAHTPGGSSQGSAAGVADRQTPLAIGTQTAGSVIRPASYCGAVGFKPSLGVVPRGGVRAISETLDTIGAMARTVADAGAFAEAMAGLPVGPPAEARPARFALCRSPAWPAVEPSSARAMDAACAAAGIEPKDLALPPPCDELLAAHDIIMPWEGARLLAHEYRAHRDRLSAEILAVIETGRGLAHERYLWALDVRERARAAFSRLFEGVDALITPAAPGEAPEGLGWTGSPECNRIWTTLGAPCITLPGLAGERGLPVGVQLVGRPGADAGLLAAAAWLHPRLAG